MSSAASTTTLRVDSVYDGPTTESKGRVGTLENPEANAISVMVRAVVSINTRAVCARWARAIAIGPAPTSATSMRWSWRTL